MQHIPLVRGREAGAELTRELERLVRRQAADAAQQRREILAVDVLHREEVLAAGFADIVDAAHVRVRDLPCEPDFLVKARQPIRSIGDLHRQELERHDLPELQILGPIHFAHPTTAQQADDAVARVQHGARHELGSIERGGDGERAGRRHGERRGVRRGHAGAASQAVAARLGHVTPAGGALHRTAPILTASPGDRGAILPRGGTKCERDCHRRRRAPGAA